MNGKNVYFIYLICLFVRLFKSRTILGVNITYWLFYRAKLYITKLESFYVLIVYYNFANNSIYSIYLPVRHSWTGGDLTHYNIII